jgi:uncharacterized cupredoxin-like copper-binding protein
MKPQRLLLLGAVVVVVAGGSAGCGGGNGGSTTQAGSTSGGGSVMKTVTISETEFKLTPSSLTFDKTGTYHLKAVNKGSVAHALEVEGNGVEKETEKIAPGESATLEVSLDKDGSYEMYCPVDGHKDQGMEGTITVGSGGSSGETSTEQTTTTDTGGSSGY